MFISVDNYIYTLYGRKAFGTVETGRKPGKIPQNFYTIIRQWAINKGVKVNPKPYKRTPSEKWQPKYTPEERGFNAFVGAVVYTIKEKGTKLFREGGREDIYTSEINKIVEEINKELPLLLKTKIIEDLRL